MGEETAVTTAKGTPTKEFFIQMLTRDIELEDAILDLLDNCLDGVMRTKNAYPDDNDDMYYKGFGAKIEFNSTMFKIMDNCGGIPFNIAKEYALRMGKPKEQIEEAKKKGLPTVGIYGIGMKRAIFKMGEEAHIYSKTEEKYFCVDIPETWLTEGDAQWDFPIDENPEEIGLDDYGTLVFVSKIYPEVSSIWADGYLEAFQDLLIDKIKKHYSFIIQKGFSISVNGVNIIPNEISLLVTEISQDGYKGRILPYVYQTEIDGVSIRMAVGFYNRILWDDEVEEEVEGTRASSEDAGWTVVCNDRVVLYNNKDYLTGWGELGIPKYHTQFIGIIGVVVFKSADPMKLPMTTTKRGIDLTSQIYYHAKGKMREGLKIFTNYTNKWKGKVVEERKYEYDVKHVPISELLKKYTDVQETLNIPFSISRNNGAGIFQPDLPMPKDDNKTRFIRYAKPITEIELVARFLYEGEVPEGIKPGQIGEKSFEYTLERAKVINDA